MMYDDWSPRDYLLFREMSISGYMQKSLKSPALNLPIVSLARRDEVSPISI